jgi:methyltransferase (TIGR00027 family)
LRRPTTGFGVDKLSMGGLSGDGAGLSRAAVNKPIRGPSRTAVVTAVARALYLEEPEPVIFEDDLALGLAGEQGRAIAERLRTELPRWQVLAFCRWMCVRSRFTEDFVQRAINRGVEQYVILGAGLDSFAYRRGDLMDRLRVFEVDHPASQSWKQDRLRDLGIEVTDNLVFAPVDFERQTLRGGLVGAGFDLARTAVFSWIGVTMYLTFDAIEATLATISECRSGSQVALSYNQPHGVLDDVSLQVTRTFQAIATELGEPFVSLFVPDEIEGLLRHHGFDDIVHFGPQEARAAWFNGAVDVAIAGAQRLIGATVNS